MPELAAIKKCLEIVESFYFKASELRTKSTPDQDERYAGMIAAAVEIGTAIRVLLPPKEPTDDR